jgi:hypothetical protein
MQVSRVVHRALPREPDRLTLSPSSRTAPFEDLSGLGFLQVIVSKTKDQLDTVRELSSAIKVE